MVRRATQHICVRCAEIIEKEQVNTTPVKDVRNKKTTVLNRVGDNEECHRAFAKGTGIVLDRIAEFRSPIDGDTCRSIRKGMLIDYEKRTRRNKTMMLAIKKHLKGKVICCDCNPDYYPEYCHAKILAKIADE